MQLGGLLEELTVAKARAGIEKLVHLTPQTARIIGHQGKKNADEKIISAEQVVVDDILRVLPGETIPVDGVILSGQTSINQAVMTGESLPVDKTAGDEVASGTVNQFGAFEMWAAKVGEDSSIQRMIRLVQSADIALVDDEVKELPHLIALSRRMMFTIKCNMSFLWGSIFLQLYLPYSVF